MDKLCIRIPPNFPVRFQGYGRFFGGGGGGGEGFALTDKSVGVLCFKYRSAGIVIT